jgi:hypothetical protein
MPFYLKEVDVVPEVSKFQSALIVICRFCPAASLAMRNEQPYIELFRRLLRTESFEQYIKDMRSRLEKEGLKTDLFQGNILNFITCMWTSGQKEKLSELAHQYDAAVVMGCESAYENVCDIVKSTDCRVFKGMESEGVFNAIPKFRWPFTISLELSSVTPMVYQKKEE